MMFTDQDLRLINLAATVAGELRRTGLTAEQYYDKYLAANEKPDWRLRPRDAAEGWIIPREGTGARQIYDLAKCGCTTSEIAKGAKVVPSYVIVTLQRLKDGAWA